MYLQSVRHSQYSWLAPFVPGRVHFFPQLLGMRRGIPLATPNVPLSCARGGPIGGIIIYGGETACAARPKPSWTSWKHTQAGRRLLESFKKALMFRRIHQSKDDLWWVESCLRLCDFATD